MVATTLVYAQVACDYTENLELVLGVENLFNEYSAKNPGHDGLGQLYREDSPFGFNRGTCYLKARYSFYVRSIESDKNLPQRTFSAQSTRRSHRPIHDLPTNDGHNGFRSQDFGLIDSHEILICNGHIGTFTDADGSNFGFFKRCIGIPERH